MKIDMIRFVIYALSIITLVGCEEDEYNIHIKKCLSNFTFHYDDVDGEYYVRAKIGNDSMKLSISEENERVMYNVPFTTHVTYKPSLNVGDSSSVTDRGFLLEIRNAHPNRQDGIFFIRAHRTPTAKALIERLLDAYLNDDVELDIRDETLAGTFNIGLFIYCYDNDNEYDTSAASLELQSESGSQTGSWLKLTELELLEGKPAYDLYALTFEFRCTLYDDKADLLKFKEEMTGKFRTRLKVDK